MKDRRKQFENTLTQIRVSPPSDHESIKDFVKTHIRPRTSIHDEKGQFDHSLVHKMFELGLLSTALPASFGGAERSLADMIWIAREIAAGSGGVSVTSTANILGFSPVAYFANPELRERLSRKSLSSYSLWSFAMTEADAGSDLRTIRTMAEKVEGGYLIQGEKNYISNGTYSTDLCVFAKTSPTEISCFYVPGDSKGLVRGLPYQKMGFREADTGRLVFKDVFVPKEHLIGQEGSGMAILFRCLGRSKTLVAAACVGLASRALELATEHAYHTKRHGKALIEQDAIRHLLARLHADLEAAWLLTCKSASTWDHGAPNDLDASMAKMVAADTGVRIANECVELLGSKGFLADCEVGRILRDVKGYEIVEGPTLVQEVLISRALLSRPVAEEGVRTQRKAA